jgi:ADP-ribosylglycohydrolase
MNEFRTRARNALLGLAMGDALSWPAMFHRSRLLPAWLRRIRREIDEQREEIAILRVAMPFSLNQSADLFKPGPGDDTEWAAWMIGNLMKHGCRVELTWVNDAWLNLAADKGPVRGGVSTVAALANLRRGVMPPSSGRDNPHYFDDGAACRSVPIGIAYAGNPSRAAEAAAIDASVTNFEDGVLIARATAAAISAACAGESSAAVIGRAVAELPRGTWSGRTVDDALTMCREDVPFLALIPSLHGILNREYSDGSVGPETIALVLAIVSRLGGDFNSAIAASTMFAKGADSVPALVGAIAGALTPGPAIPEQWTNYLDPLNGICLPALAGQSYIGLVDGFVNACKPPGNRRERT